MRIRVITYEEYTIVQSVEYVSNRIHGDGNEVTTIIF
jgi:hypothetical protein